MAIDLEKLKKRLDKLLKDPKLGLRFGKFLKNRHKKKNFIQRLKERTKIV